MKTNNKKSEKVKSKRPNVTLPKALIDRIVILSGQGATQIPLTGDIITKKTNTTAKKVKYHSTSTDGNVSTDTITTVKESVPYDNETGIPLIETIRVKGSNGVECQVAKGIQSFPNPTTTISQASEPKEEKSRQDIEIAIDYGLSGDRIKSQLKEQGLKFNKELIKGCEQARIDILTLRESDILTKKESQKAFERLNTIICFNVIERTFGDVNPIHKKTFVNDKEVK